MLCWPKVVLYHYDWQRFRISLVAELVDCTSARSCTFSSYKPNSAENGAGSVRASSTDNIRRPMPYRSYTSHLILNVMRTQTREVGPPEGTYLLFLLVHRWTERGSTGWQLRH